MNLTPTRNRVILEIQEQEQKTKGGVVLPDTVTKDRPMKGKVLAVGSGKIDKKGNRIPLQVKVGDIVYYGQYSGDEIEIDGKKYLIIKEDELLAVQ